MSWTRLYSATKIEFFRGIVTAVVVEGCRSSSILRESRGKGETLSLIRAAERSCSISGKIGEQEQPYLWKEQRLGAVLSLEGAAIMSGSISGKIGERKQLYLWRDQREGAATSSERSVKRRGSILEVINF